MLRVKSVFIVNWRSVGLAEFTLGNRTVLLGENNAGKSNLVSALNHVLGPAYPTSNRLTVTDLPFGDQDRDLQISVVVDENPAGIKAIDYRWTADQRQEARVSYEYRDEVNLTAAVRDQLPVVVIPASRSAASDLAPTPFRLFGRVQEMLHRSLMDPSESSRRDELMRAFELVRDALSTPLYQRFEAAAVDAFQETVSGAGYAADLTFRPYDTTNLYRGVRPAIVEGSLEQDVSRMGDGIANLATIAIFRAFAEVTRGTGVLVVEEPESWLHPHALRALDSSMRAIEATGAQVLVTTHSPFMARPEQFDEIVVVRKSTADRLTHVTQVTEEQLVARRQATRPEVPITAGGLRQRYRHLVRPDQSEGFFARGIVLVEGESDREVIRAVCGDQRDLDRVGVSVISCEGKRNIDQFFDLYSEFGIPTFVVFDTDSIGDSGEDDRHNHMLTRLVGDPMADRLTTTRIEATWACLHDTLDTVLNLDVDTVRGDWSTRLREEAGQLFGGASKVIQTRHILAAVGGNGELGNLRVLNELCDAIWNWATRLDAMGEPSAVTSGDD